MKGSFRAKYAKEAKDRAATLGTLIVGRMDRALLHRTPTGKIVPVSKRGGYAVRIEGRAAYVTLPSGGELSTDLEPRGRAKVEYGEPYYHAGRANRWEYDVEGYVVVPVTKTYEKGVNTVDGWVAAEPYVERVPVQHAVKRSPAEIKWQQQGTFPVKFPFEYKPFNRWEQHVTGVEAPSYGLQLHDDPGDYMSADRW